MFIAEYLIKKRQGFSAASVYFRRDIHFHIKRSSVTIMDGDMILSLMMILWHSVRQDIASYIVSKHNKVKSITISKALSTFNMVPWFVPPFEILDVCIIRNLPIHLSSTKIFPSAPIQKISILRFKANSYCIFCLKTFTKRKVRTMLHFFEG